MSSDVSPRAASAPPALSRLGPFQHASFTALWIATIVSNIGGWMYSTASGWLMTSLSPDPFIVSLVQVAASLPMFLLAIAGAAVAAGLSLIALPTVALGHQLQRDLRIADPAARVPGGARPRCGLSFASSSFGTCPRSGRRSAAAGGSPLAPTGAAVVGHRRRRVDPGAGRSSVARATQTSRGLFLVDLRVGRPGAALRPRRARLVLARPVLDHPRRRRCRRCDGSGSRLDAAPYPARLGRWPAVAGFSFFVWLELIVTGGGGGRILVAAFVAYTLVTELGMAQYGRDAWRANGEVFTVWFGLLGRIAPFALAGSPEAGLARRRPFGAGLLEPGWSPALVALVAIGVASVLYDGLSQTQLWFDVVGLPGLAGGTLTLVLFLAAAAGLALGVSRLVGSPPIGRAAGLAAVGAGLVPIATGYITGHYLTSLAGRRSAHRDRHLGPVSARVGPVRHRLLQAFPRHSSRPAPSGRRSSPPWSGATCWGRPGRAPGGRLRSQRREIPGRRAARRPPPAGAPGGSSWLG